MCVPGLIHFEGKWSNQERELVEKAAREAETEDASPHGPGCPWVIIRKDLGVETFYLASRLWETSVLTERSAADLADRIRQLG
jgi:hypothetical protein